jgi:hypothetical protein
MLAVRTKRTAMFRTHLLSQAVFRLIFTPHRDLEDRTDVGAFYIGLGDQFDDDRRLVRAIDRVKGEGERHRNERQPLR